VTGRAGPGHLVVERIDDAGLEKWATVKLQSFGDTESAPAPDRLAQEVAARRDDRALTECQLGLLDGEGVAVLAYYRGRDQLVFNLGTRVPYRHQGIAQAMLARWVDAGTASGCRSLMINATEGGRPPSCTARWASSTRSTGTRGTSSPAEAPAGGPFGVPRQRARLARPRRRPDAGRGSRRPRAYPDREMPRVLLTGSSGGVRRAGAVTRSMNPMTRP
jgi:hypothetical protein